MMCTTGKMARADSLLQRRARLVSKPARAGAHTDSLRHIHPDAVMYTWWDYRGAMFQRKLGLRIDHLLVSAALRDALQDVQVDNEARAKSVFQRSCTGVSWIAL